MKIQNDSQGFTLVEMLIALTVLAFSMEGAVAVMSSAMRMQGHAEANMLAGDVAQAVVERLRLLDFDDPLLQDPIANNQGCHNTNGSCPSDFGTASHLTTVLGDWGSASGNAKMMVPVSTVDAQFVWYEGYRFHVAWNVADNYPFLVTSL